MTLSALTMAIAACAIPTVDAGPGKPLYREQYDATRLQLLAEQVRRDFSCEGPIDVQPTSSYTMFTVKGCGRKAIYAEIVCDKNGMDTIRFISPLAAKAGNPRLYDGRVCSGERMLKLAAEDVELIDHAARDLACPRDEIVPVFWQNGRAPNIRTAEGCGRRATYLPGEGLHLASVVKIGE